MQTPENVHLTSCKHKSHLLNFFLALSQKSAYYSFPAHIGQRWDAVNQKTGITKLLFEGQVTAFPSTLGACSWLSWAALPRWHFSRQPTHAAEGCPQDSERAFVACMSRHAPPQQVPKAVPAQVHVPTQSRVWVSAGRRARSHYVCTSDCEILQQKSLARHVESLGGWHISACMSVATKTYYRAVTETYLFTLIS